MRSFYFNRLSNVIVRMMHRRGFSCVINCLDDFLIIGRSRDDCQRALLSLINLLLSLGFSVSWKKVASPAKRVTFLGIELDSQDMSLRLPEDKLHCLSEAVHSFFKSHRIGFQTPATVPRGLSKLCMPCRSRRTDVSSPCVRLYQ